MKCFSYSAFISAKFFISVMNALTLTTLSIEEPAAARMDLMLAIHAAVFSPIVPSTNSPDFVAGI